MSRLKIKYVKSQVEESGNIKGRFLIYNLSNSQSITIGNALRRILLSDIKSTAITKIKIPAISHEFSSIPGIREDILEIILNIKQIKLKTNENKKIFGKIKVNGPGIITANLLNFNTKVEILNPNQYIATISKKIDFEIDVIAEEGIGYKHNEQKKHDNNNSFLDIDAIFMPVLEVNYKPNSIQLSPNEQIECLEIEITTNGTLTPEEALVQASQKLISWFKDLTEYNPTPKIKTKINIKKKTLNKEEEIILLEELGLSARAYNCLKRSGITSINQLKDYSEEEIKNIKNFGKKSINDVIFAMKKKFNITLKKHK